MKNASKPQPVVLDPEARSPAVLEFEQQLQSCVIGQERAVRRMVNMYQIFLAGMNTPGRPVGTMLFLGPTGSGKTRVVEASADILFGSPRAFIKIDCAEFQPQPRDSQARRIASRVPRTSGNSASVDSGGARPASHG